MTAADAGAELRSLLAASAELPAFLGSVGRLVAVGWATVELDRAEAELAVSLGLPAGAFTDVAPTTHLGAWCRVALGAIPHDVHLVLLEPSTEGRLAASLARHGERPVAAWFEVAGLAAVAADLGRRGQASTVASEGPFGAERLLLGGPVHGPYHLVVERPGTIRA